MTGKYYIVLLLLIGLASFVYAADEYDLEINSVQTLQANTYCPVMPEMKVDKQVFTDHKHNRNRRRLSPRWFIEPLGITTLSLLVFTGITGIFRRKLPRALVKRHKPLGVITIVSAIIHAALVLIAH